MLPKSLNMGKNQYELKKTSADYKHLSSLDKEILKILLNPKNGKRSSEILSERTGSPISTIQRGRKLLEQEYLELTYTLLIEKFGWRRGPFNFYQ